MCVVCVLCYTYLRPIYMCVFVCALPNVCVCVCCRTCVCVVGDWWSSVNVIYKGFTSVYYIYHFCLSEYDLCVREHSCGSKLSRGNICCKEIVGVKREMRLKSMSVSWLYDIGAACRIVAMDKLKNTTHC